MIVTITMREIREGAKGDYLYIKYVTSKGKESGKAVFNQLKDKWEMCQENATVDLKLDERYNVIDIQSVSEQLPEPQVSTPESETPPSSQSTDVETAPESETPPPHAVNTKNRSYALSYAKDLVVAKVIEADKVLSYAEVFDRFLNGDISVQDEAVFKSLIEKHFKIKG